MDTGTGIAIGLAAVIAGFAWKKSQQNAAPQPQFPQYAYQQPSPYAAPSPYSQFQQFVPPPQYQQYVPQPSSGRGALDPNLTKLIGTGIQSAPQLIASLGDAFSGLFGGSAEPDPASAEFIDVSGFTDDWGIDWGI